MKKKITEIICILLVIVVLAVTATACVKTEGKKYFDMVSEYSFWDNKASESIAQYKFFDIMDEHLSEGVTIENGKAIDNVTGKTRKVFFLGWDGTRADALTNIFYDENNFDTNSYNYEVAEYSGLHRLKSQGGLYMAYAGGEKGKDSQQEASTCAGFTSELTGGWNTYHGVDLNSDVKKAEADTIMMKYAKKGLNTGFAFDWGQFFDITLQKEVEYIIQNPDLPILYRDINRTKATSKDEIMKNEGLTKEKDINAKSIEHYNAVAIDGDLPEHSQYDIAMRNHLLSRIEADDDIVAGVFHCPDTNGHTTGFSNINGHYLNSVRNANIYLYQILMEIEYRQANLNEDWLVIVTTDHGGNERSHGYQIYENRTTWVACNKAIDSSYYGKNYDGMQERS